jgi:hypothetical protein
VTDEKAIQQRVLCKLENGLDANIYYNPDDCDFFDYRRPPRDVIDQGAVVTGRISKISFSEKIGKNTSDDNFFVNLKCKKEDLRKHDMSLLDSKMDV